MRCAPRHVIVAVCDHFEPFWRKADSEQANVRVREWTRLLPQLAARYCDADGRKPKHTFFCAMDEMTDEQLTILLSLKEQNLAEFELHLHHRNDSASSLTHLLIEARNRMWKLGCLPCAAADGAVRYGFIHGNWALANTRPDGDWCGVPDELKVLLDTGCYADFTFPSAPDATQPTLTNALYYPSITACGPGALDHGIESRCGCSHTGRLLLITGPIGLNFDSRKWGVLPRIENGALRQGQDVTPQRIRRWLDQRIGVQQRPEWVFVKLYCHGAQERDWPVLLGPGYHRLHNGLRGECARLGCQLHYASAREMANMIFALEEGWQGDPEGARNYRIILP